MIHTDCVLSFEKADGSFILYSLQLKRLLVTDGSVGHHMGARTLGINVDRLGSPVLFEDGTALLFSPPFQTDGLFEMYWYLGKETAMKKVAIVMGSSSDLAVVQKAAEMLQEFSVPYEVHVYSAHRTPEEAKTFAGSARKNGFGVILAAAGKAAHLAGALAANTTLPVVGIPIKSSTLDGLDALLSTVQMPTGIPVATVAIDGAANAALLAIEILAVEDAALAEKLTAKRAADTAKVLADNAAIEQQFHQ